MKRIVLTAPPVTCEEVARHKSIPPATQRRIQRQVNEVVAQYPTPEAYELACKALWKHRQKVEDLKGLLREVLAALEMGTYATAWEKKWKRLVRKELQS